MPPFTGNRRQGREQWRAPSPRQGVVFNNINDLHAAWELVQELATGRRRQAYQPCGVVGADIYTAFMRAYEADPVSIWRIVASTGLDGKTAKN